VIVDGIVPHEHELAHAVHRELWPASRPFLHEGLAVLLGDSDHFENGEWPSSKLVDPVLEASGRDLDYWSAWFIVSQIVRDHDFEGLRAFWHAVPPDATAEDIRGAYATTFGRPLDALFEPDLVDVPWMDADVEEPRHACYFAVCPTMPKPWVAESWSAAPPVACESDEGAVGPTMGKQLGDVWRPYVAETGLGPHQYSASGLAMGVRRQCALRCGRDDRNGASGVGPEQSYDESATTETRQRWDVGIQSRRSSDRHTWADRDRPPRPMRQAAASSRP
jgi:hypothetical protein